MSVISLFSSSGALLTPFFYSETREKREVNYASKCKEVGATESNREGTRKSTGPKNGRVKKLVSLKWVDFWVLFFWTDLNSSVGNGIDSLLLSDDDNSDNDLQGTVQSAVL